MKAIIHGRLLLVAANAHAALDPELSTWLDANRRIESRMVWAGCTLTETNTSHCTTNWDVST